MESRETLKIYGVDDWLKQSQRILFFLIASILLSKDQ